MADLKAHQMILPVSVRSFNFATGTWTYSANSGIPFYSKGAADETAVVTVPIKLPVMRGEVGVQLDKIEIPLRIATADLDAVLAGVLTRCNHYKAVTAAGTNIDTTAVTITETGTAVTNAATDRLYTATVSSPAFSYDGTVTAVSWELQLTINAGATSAIRVYDALVYYTSAQ